MTTVPISKPLVRLPYLRLTEQPRGRKRQMSVASPLASASANIERDMGSTRFGIVTAAPSARATPPKIPVFDCPGRERRLARG